MDTISHALIGGIISLPQKIRKSVLRIIFFSVLPDLPLIPFYIFLGYINKRAFLIPHNSDWIGATKLYPILNSFYEISHSLFFLLLIILPLVIYFKLPKMAFFAYLIHIAVDLPTHTGEWAIKLFYPFNYSFNGFTNSWAWPIYIMAISWLFLAIIIILLRPLYRKQ